MLPIQSSGIMQKNNQMLYSYFIINAIGKFCTFYNIWEGLEIIIIMPEGFEMLVHCWYNTHMDQNRKTKRTGAQGYWIATLTDIHS